MGMAPSVTIYDEYGQSESDDLYRAMDTAMGKRAEPLLIVISTQAARNEAPLSTLIDYGLRILLTFPGRSTDPKVVALKIAELHGRYNIRALAYDRWRIEDLTRELDAIGCSVPLVAFGQGFKDLSPAVDVLERLVEEGKLRHGNHPVLAMAAVNARVELDAAGNRKLSKRRSVGRIDPLVALCMALGVAARPAPVIDVSAMIG
jgi:phage terminase large subunit-like protein